MPRRPATPAQLHAASADDVEHQFDDALRDGDLELLMALWADDDEIVCVMPGGERLVGHAEIRAGFEAVFAIGRLLFVPRAPRRVQTMQSALHSRLVTLAIQVAGESRPRPQGHLVVTNMFVRTPRGWRLAAHHASAGEAPRTGDATSAATPGSDEVPPPSRLH